MVSCKKIFDRKFNDSDISISWTWDVQFGIEDEVAPRRLPREAAQLRVAEAGRQCHRLSVLRRRGGHRGV